MIKSIYKSFILFFLKIFIIFPSISQNQPTYTQYIYNQIITNSAYSGNNEGLNFTFLGREQWLGFEGGPSVQSFTMNYLVPKKSLGMGLWFVNDKIGLSNNSQANIAISYSIKLGNGVRSKPNSPGSRFSFGMQGGATRFQWRLTEARINGGNTGIQDPNFQMDVINAWILNLGLGMVLSINQTYLGVGIPFLINNQYKLKDQNQELNFGTSNFITLGTAITIHPKLVWKPSTQVVYTEGSPLEVNSNLLFTWNNIINMGVSWRYSESIGFLFGVHFLKNWRLGYSFDLITNELKNYTGGSHELMLGFSLVPLYEQEPMHPRYF